MSFTDTQIKALGAKLNGKQVRTRRRNGIELSYLEGWHLIAEANRIFGFDAWDRETVHSQCVWQSNNKGSLVCSYIARVRVSVRAGENTVVREGSGSGHGRSQNVGEAHESALKEAETDATKRALATFGNPFGLALYDKEQKDVRKPRTEQKQNGAQGAVAWPVITADGSTLNTFADPVDFCSTIKTEMERLGSAMETMGFWACNEEMVSRLQEVAPDLVTERGQHYADILSQLYTDKLSTFEAKPDVGTARSNAPTSSSREEQKGIPSGKRQAATRNGLSAKTRKRAEPASKPKRLRNSEHLKFVTNHACLFCGRMPSQAHHVRYAQPRAMSRKVSDEWTVPLCNTHHDDLHRAGDEKRWWSERDIDPLREAKRMWEETQREKAPQLLEAS